jgi:hypothetical protein
LVAGGLPLKYARTPSQFKATLPIHERGSYELFVYAYYLLNANTGHDQVTYCQGIPGNFPIKFSRKGENG